MRLAPWLLIAGLTACGDEPPPDPTGGGGEAGNTAPRIGAELACEPGELEGDDGSCLAPGIPADGCGEGFVWSDDACTATLPAAPCATGTIALPGDTACAPLAPCTGTWGDAPIDGSTIYVQSGQSIQAAIDTAPNGALIAIAPGTYTEALFINKSIRLWGACPSTVVIDGAMLGAIYIQAAQVELHDIAVTGQYGGVSISSGAGIVVDRVHIHDTGYAGFQMTGGSATLSRSLLERNASAAVNVFGAALTLTDTALRDVLPDSSGQYGFGISADQQLGIRATLTARHILVSNAHTIGIGLWGADAVIEDSLVADTQPRQSDQLNGHGIQAFNNAQTGQRANVTIRGTVVERNYWAGISVEDADAVIERTVIRDSYGRATDGAYGFGLRASHFDMNQAQPHVTISQSLIERTHFIGFVSAGAEVSAHALVVRDVEPRQDSGEMGRPISVEPSWDTKLPSLFTLDGARLERGYEAGLMIIGSTADLRGVWVRDIAPDLDTDAVGAGVLYVRDIFNEIDTGGVIDDLVVENVHTVGLAALGSSVQATDVVTRNILPEVASGDFGDGIIASEWIFIDELFDADMTLTRMTVDAAPRAGIVAWAADVSLAESALECNAIQLGAERFLDADPRFEDLGGNRCGCAEQEEACKILSSDIQPPSPPL